MGYNVGHHSRRLRGLTKNPNSQRGRLRMDSWFRRAVQTVAIVSLAACGGGGGGTSEVDYTGSYQATVVRSEPSTCQRSPAHFSGTMNVLQENKRVRVRIFQVPIELVGVVNKNTFVATGEYPAGALNCVQEVTLTATPFEGSNASELALDYMVGLRVCDGRPVIPCSVALAGSATKVSDEL